MLAPLAAVVLFLAAIVSAFWYLRLEEMDREQEAVKRDVEYAQQRVRLRLLERQEQLMRIARDISNNEVDAKMADVSTARKIQEVLTPEQFEKWKAIQISSRGQK